MARIYTLSEGKRSPLVSKSKPGATSCSMKSPEKPRSSAVRRSQRLTPMKSKPTARCVDSAVVSAKTSKPYVVVEKIRKSSSDNDSSSKLLDRPAGVLNNMRSSVVTSCVEKSAVSDRLSVFDDISSQGGRIILAFMSETLLIGYIVFSGGKKIIFLPLSQNHNFKKILFF